MSATSQQWRRGSRGGRRGGRLYMRSNEELGLSPVRGRLRLQLLPCVSCRRHTRAARSRVRRCWVRRAVGGRGGGWPGKNLVVAASLSLDWGWTCWGRAVCSPSASPPLVTMFAAFRKGDSGRHDFICRSWQGRGGRERALLRPCTETTLFFSNAEDTFHLLNGLKQWVHKKIDTVQSLKTSLAQMPSE